MIIQVLVSLVVMSVITYYFHIKVVRKIIASIDEWRESKELLERNKTTLRDMKNNISLSTKHKTNDSETITITATGTSGSGRFFVLLKIADFIEKELGASVDRSTILEECPGFNIHDLESNEWLKDQYQSGRLKFRLNYNAPSE